MQPPLLASTHDHGPITAAQSETCSSSKNIATIIKQHVTHVAVFSLFYNLLLFSSPLYMLQIYNRILPARAEEALLNITLLVLCMLATMGVLDAVRQLVLVRLARQVENTISQEALTAVITPPRKSNATSRHQQVLHDIDQLRSLLSKGHLLHILDTLWLPGFLIALALLHPLLALIALTGVALLGVLGVLAHLVVTPATKQANRSAWRVMSIADQMIAKADVIRGLGMAPAIIQKWDGVRVEAASDHMTASQKLGMLTAASKALKVSIQSLTLGLGAYLAIQDAVSAGAIIAGSILVGRALGPIEASILAWHEISKAWEGYRRLASLRRTRQQAPGPAIVVPSHGALIVERLSCVIGERPVLRDISFELDPGQLLAIIGPSGAGKTTLTKYLVGAWCGAGAVRLDGLDVASMTDEAKQRCVGYLPQESQLFDSTVIETISRFGAPTAEEILATAELAGIQDMILRLPDDYGTHIGIDGCVLSGGQRQRLALARALYGSPALVVLDEPCAHLDEAGERRLVETLQAIKKRQTTICLVTHKVNFIHLADRILVLNARGEARFGAPRDLFQQTLRPVPTKAAAA